LYQQTFFDLPDPTSIAGKCEKYFAVFYIVLNLNRLSVFYILAVNFLSVKKKQNIFQLLLFSALENVNS